MSTNALAPPLSPAESDIVRSYGDWTTFMASFNLSSFDDDDVDEAKGILESFVEASQDEA